MKGKITKILIMLVIGIYSCTMSNSDKTVTEKQTIENQIINLNSRVTHFDYGGYGDNNMALLYGDIYETVKINNLKDTLTPLLDVLIAIEQKGFKILTNSDGHFTIGFDKGSYNLTISKKGYQSLHVTNYISDPDQVSMITIILEKGTVVQTFKIPDRKK